MLMLPLTAQKHETTLLRLWACLDPLECGLVWILRVIKYSSGILLFRSIKRRLLTKPIPYPLVYFARRI